MANIISRVKQTGLLRIWPVLIAVIVILCTFVTCCWWWTCWLNPTTTVLIVRHAERTAGDELNPDGLLRSETLVHVAKATGLDAIYVSQYQRTQQTAAPLAIALSLVPTQMNASNSQAVADDILANHRGGHVLVVGHSNTVPEIIEALGGPLINLINEDEFDNLFVLTKCGRRVRLIELHYGSQTPP